MTFDVQAARRHFPALDQGQIYFDNAGGTQVISAVINSIKDYLSTNNVQLGATYKAGQLSTQKYDAGITAAAKYINATPDEIVIGPSTTQLFRNLSVSLWPYFEPSSEIILSAVDHEANLASWVYLAERLNLKVKWWKPNDSQTNPHLTPESLKPLMSENTRLVACTHTSNILGSITDVQAIADVVHTVPGALLCIDGVAYSPHRPLDMAAFGADIYGFSWYKVCGPHCAQLYVKRSVQDTAMKSLGHYFKDGWTLEEKLGLAGASYELVQALPTVTKYLEDQGWDKMVEHEVMLQDVLVSYLKSRPDTYTIYGEPSSDGKLRVPVISFGVKGRGSQEVVEAIEQRTQFGFRWGHFYSKRLINSILNLGDEGVVRVSMFHYNTREEIEKFVSILDAEVCK